MAVPKMELKQFSADHVTNGADAILKLDDDVAGHDPGEAEDLVNECQDQDESKDVVCGLENHREAGLRTRRKVKLYAYSVIFLYLEGIAFP